MVQAIASSVEQFLLRSQRRTSVSRPPMRVLYVNNLRFVVGDF